MSDELDNFFILHNESPIVQRLLLSESQNASAYPKEVVTGRFSDDPLRIRVEAALNVEVHDVDRDNRFPDLFEQIKKQYTEHVIFRVSVKARFTCLPDSRSVSELPDVLMWGVVLDPRVKARVEKEIGHLVSNGPDGSSNHMNVLHVRLNADNEVVYTVIRQAFTPPKRST